MAAIIPAPAPPPPRLLVLDIITIRMVVPPPNLPR